MSFATAHGLRFHTQELGSGAPAIMLHGLLIGSLTTWYFSAAPALARNHRVLLYDLRGHGKTERAARGYDLPTMSEDLGALAAGFSPEPLLLVGHSYGAAVALRFTIDHPERVSKLVLVECPLPPSNLQELEAFAQRSTSSQIEQLPPIVRHALAHNGRQTRRFLDDYRFLTRESSLLADLQSGKDLTDAELATVRCPVLCVYGATSSCRPVGDRLARALPRATLVELEGGHFLPLEAPGALTAAIVRFAGG